MPYREVTHAPALAATEYVTIPKEANSAPTERDTTKSPASAIAQPESFSERSSLTGSKPADATMSSTSASPYRKSSGRVAPLVKDEERRLPFPSGSSLSLRDMYEESPIADDLPEGSATEVSSSSNKTGKVYDTPPTSVLGTPVGPEALTGVSMEALSLLGASAKMVGPSSAEASLNSLNHRPLVLYSAIGSLEDPSNHSLKRQGWQSKLPKKHEFPSLLLLPPARQVRLQAAQKAAPKRSGMSALLNAAAAQTTETSQAVSASTAGETAKATSSSTKDNMEENQRTIKASNIRTAKIAPDTKSENKSVKIADDTKIHKKRSKRPVEQFRPSSDAYTPRMGKKEIKYQPAAQRTPVQQMTSGLGTLSRPNFRDALRRVAMIIRQHIVKIERRFESQLKSPRRGGRDALFMQSMKEAFSEDNFATPTYRCTMVRVPMALGGMVGGLKKVRKHYEIPSEGEIYEFAHRLFNSVQLSSECSIVCLIYIERLMEVAKVPLLASTWRPTVMCGLLLASKVWQDLSSWNIEFATVYPQYSLDSIHRLELQFLRMVKWDLYISSSLYAKYYFALRALVGKKDFRQRYNRMVGGVDSVQVLEARKIEERSTLIKEEALLQLSRSM
jgi:hypothetical protein